MATSKYVILSDFDGTIITQDSALLALKSYGTENWRQYDDLLLKGEISLEECLSKQFSSLTVSQEILLKSLSQRVFFRPSFEDFIVYCKRLDLPFIIVSAGIDFLIKHFLRRINGGEQIPIVAGISNYTSKGIIFEFPKKKYVDSKNFKEDLVIDFKNQGFFVIYIGDGSGDYYAARISDLIYAVEGSELSRLCEKNQTHFRSFTDFKTIISDLTSLL